MIRKNNGFLVKKDAKCSKTLKRLSPGFSIVCWKVKSSDPVERFVKEKDYLIIVENGSNCNTVQSIFASMLSVPIM